MVETKIEDEQDDGKKATEFLFANSLFSIIWICVIWTMYTTLLQIHINSFRLIQFNASNIASALHSQMNSWICGLAHTQNAQTNAFVFWKYCGK